MAPKSRLRQALAAEKNVDFQKLKEKKKAKARGKTTAASHNEARLSDLEEADWTDEHDSDDASEDRQAMQLDLDAVDDSDTSDSSIELEKKMSRPKTQAKLQSISPQKANGGDENARGDQEEEEEDEEEEDIPVSDLEDLDDEDKEDLVPHTRLTINNTSALLAALDRISIPTDKTVPFSNHQCVLSTDETAASIPDVQDDLQRELAFYTQCLEAARQGRSKLIAEGVPFSRPKDYFAEMVKEDAHMEKVKAKLVEEASAKKASAEARKLRDLKKYGKQVQIAKLQERQKAKRETLDKIKTLKRKRQESNGDVGTNEGDLFDIAVDNEISNPSQRSRAGKQSTGSNAKRQKKDEKYGFGGKKRHAKSGDAMSSGDLSSFNARKMKSDPKSKGKKVTRPGKSRRKSMASH